MSFIITFYVVYLVHLVYKSHDATSSTVTKVPLVPLKQQSLKNHISRYENLAPRILLYHSVGGCSNGSKNAIFGAHIILSY